MIIVYKNVFDRDTIFESTFETYLNNPSEIFDALGNDLESLETIRNEADKYKRNDLKRTNLQEMDLSMSGVFAIDIDGISNKPELKKKIVDKLSNLPTTYVVKESVSGNIVAFFKYDCSVAKYPFLYYKMYLELTILLAVNIDFLPEIGRLRYVDANPVIYMNESSDVVVDILEVDELPYIKTSLGRKDARHARYGSN